MNRILQTLCHTTSLHPVRNIPILNNLTRCQRATRNIFFDFKDQKAADQTMVLSWKGIDTHTPIAGIASKTLNPQLSSITKQAQEGNLDIIQAYGKNFPQNFKYDLLRNAISMNKKQIVQLFISENILDYFTILSCVCASENSKLFKELMDDYPGPNKHKQKKRFAYNLFETASLTQHNGNALYLLYHGVKIDSAFFIAVKTQNKDLMDTLKMHPKLTSRGIRKAIEHEFKSQKPNIILIEQLLKDPRLNSIQIKQLMKNKYIPEEVIDLLFRHVELNSEALNAYLAVDRGFFNLPEDKQVIILNAYEQLTKHLVSDEKTVTWVLYYAINVLSIDVVMRQIQDKRLSYNGCRSLMKSIAVVYGPWSVAQQSDLPYVKAKINIIDTLIRLKQRELEAVVEALKEDQVIIG